MAIFRYVTDLWNYVSPRKTQQRRDKEFKVPAVPVRTTPLKRQRQVASSTSAPAPARTENSASRYMSPNSRVHVWTVRTPSPLSDDDVDQTLLPPSPPASARQAMDDLEGDTLLGSPMTYVTSKTGSSGAEVDANEDTMLVDDGNYLDKSIDVDEERLKREKQCRELRSAGWSEDAIFLFQKLGMRGLEPLLPMHWLDDLETLPGDLFTARPDKAFLTSTSDDDYPGKCYIYHNNGEVMSANTTSAQQALINLFDLGGRVRDARITKAIKRTPHFHIKRAIQRFTAWAMKDGKVDRLWSELPLFRTVIWDVKVHATIGEQEMIQKLSALYNRWYDALQFQASEEQTTAPEVPTLYGVTASHTVLAFVSFAPPTDEKTKPQLRLIAMFDFNKEGYDVWHSLAIAIFVTHCRNRMMQLKDSLPEPEISSEEDPDL